MYIKQYYLYYVKQGNGLDWPFTADSSDWFDDYAGTVFRYDMFPGRTTYLKPASELTRGDVAIAIYTYLSSQ